MAPFQGTYSPAMNLAHWLWISENRTQLPNSGPRGLAIEPGTVGNPLSAIEIADGLAAAHAQFEEAEGTPEQLEAAQDALTAQLKAGNYAAAGGPGYADASQSQRASDLYEAGFYISHPEGKWSTDELSAMNEERLDELEYLKKHFPVTTANEPADK